HLAAGAAALYVARTIYGGQADALGYDRQAVTFAASLRSGHLVVPGSLSGSGAPPALAGTLYALVGAHTLAGFVFFAWLGFLGLFFFYRAFTIGIPDGDRRIFRIAVFFLPSLVLWPSFLGKEAIMVFGGGLATYGVAVAYRRSILRALPWLAAGGAAM